MAPLAVEEGGLLVLANLAVLDGPIDVEVGIVKCGVDLGGEFRIDANGTGGVWIGRVFVKKSNGFETALKKAEALSKKEATAAESQRADWGCLECADR
jgi:hypothetical protein